jgi:hypothetical protein
MDTFALSLTMLQLRLRRWKVVIRRDHNPEIASANLAAATCYNFSSSVTGDARQNRFDNCRAVFAFQDTIQSASNDAARKNCRANLYGEAFAF